MADSFPKFTRQRRIGEEGVNAVSSIVNDHFGWIFRRNHQEDDFGIDGYIDFVSDMGHVTGKSIAVQIKCGASFFKNKAQNGYYFDGSLKHINYYMNMSIPVLIVIHNPKTGELLWDKFDVHKTTGTKTGWRLIIPHRNILSSDRDKILNLFGESIDHIPEIKGHWAFNELMSSSDYIHYAVDRDDIERLNTSHFHDFMKRITANDDLARKLQGKIQISISGYDQDKRELFEIDDVKKWFSVADAVFKHWFFFLSDPIFPDSLKCYFACMCDAQRENVKAHNKTIYVSMDTRKMVKVFETNFLRLNTMTEKLRMTLQDNKRISFAVDKIINGATRK